ncbi:integrator complex subunit 14 [Neodiprion pinetum]|uniref:Integrator complex subunit 14 n=1 Tax=Neodiprion lecontei TaxID=441921 RepID=A0A6J0BGI5_NEOLC|nr:integrator complex subunit 14 [Neodiprion lecontei]XP_046424945.1 integrator complex subunit 14 [Neodiprion fabricii]XP_046484214.1 integrator complex subunit 14 [Neodiprion pinetum]XP_046618750.1 integrator complex subunit 14 [Neodiprion virginianus]
MPTVIALDVSLSMRRPVVGSVTPDGTQSEQLTRHHLAIAGINALIDYLQVNSKLEFVALVVFSSLYEVICPFTRDYDSIRAKLQNIEECDKTCVETALHGVNTVVMAEWGNTTACQVVLVTDGNPGVGPMSLGDSLNSLTVKRDSNLFPLPFPYPGKLTVVCISSQQDPGLAIGMPLYQRLVELAGGNSIVLVPEGPLTRNSVTNCFQKLAEVNYVSFQGYLKCGQLGSRILLSPPPLPYTKKTDFEILTGQTISKTLEICGFISVVDVGSPNAISRHLVLPLPTERTTSMQGINLEEDSDTDDNGDEGKTPSFCVLLHGALKVENMAALCLLNSDWYGFIYSWADTKKKSNLMLTVLEPGSDVIPWLGNLNNLGPVDASILKDGESGFPVKPTEKRSYSQNAPSWIRQVGLQSDIQKILRHARKLPEKTQNFYKELNRLRRAALSMGFVELLDGLASIFERECTLLPANLNPDCTIQMGHVAEMLKKPYSRELKNNITPVRTKFHPD